MNVPNPKLLKSLHKPGLCDYCRKPCTMRCGAHVFSVGSGRVDCMWNLIQTAMSPWHGCNCHGESHAGRSPSRQDFLRIVSKREGVPVDLIIETIAAIRACPWQISIGNVSTWLTKAFREEVAVAALGIIRESGIYREDAE